MPKAVIVSAARTPIGKFQGGLAPKSAPDLGALSIKEALRRADLSASEVQEVFMGCVLQAGVGQAPARQAMIFAGVPNTVPATTINKVCGSGLKAIITAAQTVLTGDNKVVVAGGMESMSNVPYLLDRARTGYRLGHGQIIDGIIKDGLWDVYNNFHMGDAGERCAKECGISREQQDEFAAESYRRAQAAIKEGRFDKEIVAVEIESKKGPTTIVKQDEEPFAGDVGKLPSLKAAFQKDGTITAGNASSLNDGGAAVVVMSDEEAKRTGRKPLATIVGYANAAQAPELFTTAPAVAIQNVLAKTGLKLDDIDLFEVNQAFSVVSLAVAQRAKLDLSRTDVNGGAVALGHPIGASGARVLVTLLHALEARGLKRGLATLCIGGGEAVAMIVERA
ncbi:MAG: thiolase family protein [Deltaproteobacteria bacterium]|nr:thiolase family protein [Deltaproteobacteria bacterium]